MNPSEIIKIIETMRTDDVIDFSDAIKIINKDKRIPKKMKNCMANLLYKRSMGWRV